MEMGGSSRTRECKRTSEAAGASSSSSSSSSSTSSSKRRKVGSPEGAACSGSCSLLTGSVEEVRVAVSPVASLTGSGELSRTSFSSDLPALSTSPSIFDLGEVVEEGFLVGDQLEESLEMEISASACFKCNFSKEATPSSELCHDCEKNPLKMELQQFSADNRRTQEVEAGRKRMLPPLAEIEEFFSAAEKYEQKRFTEKYNYDVAEDVPLHGRYQWIRLKP